jgi:predicted ATP-grasp superfamily ATP-dependent carboligase
MRTHVPMTIFVTDGNQRPALAIVRALGRHGATVLVGDEQPVSLASASKYCARHVTYPSPYRDREAFDRFLIDFLRREKVDVVVPVTDVTMHSICGNQDAIGRHAALAIPPFDAFTFVSNKGKLLEAAGRCGIPIPRTHVVDGLAGLRDVVGRVQYPVVIKPSRSRILTGSGWLPATVHYAYSENELRRIYRETPYLEQCPSLIQERIVGPGVGVFVLFDRGHLIADFGHRRLREKPPSGGVSVLRESMPVDPRLREYAIGLLGPIGWHGVAMMEYKQDCRTGELFLMEVNGRFWGSLQLAIDAGVDFPQLVCELALGRRPAAPPGYRLGVKSRWLLGDVDHLFLRLVKSDRELCLPPSAPSRARTVVDFLKFAGPDLHYEVARPSDPRPFLHELRQAARSLSASAAQFVRRRGSRGDRLDAHGQAVTPAPLKNA